MVNSVPRYIYFIKPVGMDGPIKIGCSTKPAKRLMTLGPWNPHPLEIIAVAPGNLSTEKLIHAHYAEELWHHEWFHASPRLIAATTALKRGATLAQAMPLIFADDTRKAA
jgi:hypothetical protein